MISFLRRVLRGRTPRCRERHHNLDGYTTDGLIPVLASEGYAVVTDGMVDRYGVDRIAELGGIPAANVLRASDWIRDHYRDGIFRCPSDGGGGGHTSADKPGL